MLVDNAWRKRRRSYSKKAIRRCLLSEAPLVQDGSRLYPFRCHFMMQKAKRSLKFLNISKLPMVDSNSCLPILDGMMRLALVLLPGLCFRQVMQAILKLQKTVFTESVWMLKD